MSIYGMGYKIFVDISFKELTEKCVKFMNTKYEPNIKKKKLAETLHLALFIETTGFVTHELVPKRNNSQNITYFPKKVRYH